MQMQMALADVSPREIMRCRTFGDALDLGAKVAGLAPKELQADLRLDKAQWSRWLSEQEGVRWEKLQALQQRCGNTVPVQWLCWASGFDLASMRRQENELERDNRLLREENDALRRVLIGQGAR